MMDVIIVIHGRRASQPNTCYSCCLVSFVFPAIVILILAFILIDGFWQTNKLGEHFFRISILNIEFWKTIYIKILFYLIIKAGNSLMNNMYVGDKIRTSQSCMAPWHNNVWDEYKESALKDILPFSELSSEIYFII